MRFFVIFRADIRPIGVKFIFNMDMKRLFLLFLLAVTCMTCMFAASMEGFTRYQLDNGLTILLWEDQDAPDVFGATVTRAGAVDEPSTATGLAHYLEHMLFKGTETMCTLDWEKERPYYEQVIALYDELAQTTDPKAREAVQLRINEASRAAAQYSATDEFSNLIQSIGGEGLNAGTGEDLTYYHNSFPAHQMERWLTLYSDRLINPVFRTFQAELENVFEEYNMYQDDNNEHVRELVAKHLYAGTPYERPIIGYPEDLKNPKLRQLIEFFHAWYVPNNMALILVGNFNTEEVKPLIEKTFGRLQTQPLPERMNFGKTEFAQDERYTAKLGYMPELLICYDGITSNHPDADALNFAMSILSNSMGIGLLDQLAMDNKLMYAAAMCDSKREMGRIQVVAVPYMDVASRTFKSIKETEPLVRTELDRLIAGDFSDELIETVRMHELMDFQRQMEYPMMKAMVMLQDYAYGIDIEEDLSGYEARIRAITRDDIVRVAKQYLTRPSKTFEITEGTPKKNKLAKPKIKPIDSPKGQSEYYQHFTDIPAGHLTPKFTDLTDIDKDNFTDLVHVYVTPNPKNDIFSLRLKYGVGTYELPKLSYATQLMNVSGIKGAPGVKASEYRAKLASLGAKCDYSVDENYLYVDIEGNEANLKDIIELINLHQVFPDFKAAENDMSFQNILGQEYSSRQIEQTNTDMLSSAAFNYVLFGEDSPQIRRVPLMELLTETTVDQLESVFHRALDYELEIHYVGRLAADSVKSVLFNHLSFTDNGRPTTSPIQRDRIAVDKQEIYFLGDKNMQQAKIYFYLQGDPYTTRDAVLYEAFNEYFSGGFSGLVLNEIREKRSMAYTAYGYFQRPRLQSRNAGFFGYVGTQSDKVADALDVYFDLMQHMPAYEDNIESVRTVLRQSMLSNKPTFRTKSQCMTDWNRLGYAIDPATLQIRQVQKLKFQDIMDFYAAHMQNQPVRVLIVGDPKLIDLKRIEKTYGKVKKLNRSKLFSNDDIQSNAY